MTKTPEIEAAEAHADSRCPEQGPEFIVWCMCRDDFLAGVEWERKRLADKMNGPYGLGPVSEPETHAQAERINEAMRKMVEHCRDNPIPPENILILDDD